MLPQALVNALIDFALSYPWKLLVTEVLDKIVSKLLFIKLFADEIVNLLFKKFNFLPGSITKIWFHSVSNLFFNVSYFNSNFYYFTVI